MSAAEEFEMERLSLPEINAPDDLLAYLRGQLIDGIGKERHENEREEHSPNGTFYKFIDPDDPSFPDLVWGSVRFILKPPHPQDVSGDFWEVFGIFEPPLTNYDFMAEDFNDLAARLSRGNGFVLHRYQDREPGDYYWAHMNGAHKLEEVTLEEILSPPVMAPFDPFRIAYSLYKDVQTCNIVATTE